MMIGLDLREWQKFPTGITRYWQGLVPSLITQGKNDFFYLLINPVQEIVSFLPKSSNYKIITTSAVSKSINQFIHLPSEINALNLDWWLVTPYGFTPGIKAKTALLIFDLLYRHYPKQAGWKALAYQILLEKRAADLSSLVITISDFCLWDIVKTLSVRQEKMAVVYPAVSISFSKPPTVSFSAKLPFFLAVGNFRSHKNLPFLLQVFSQWLHQSESKANLFIVGGDLPERSREGVDLQRLSCKLGIAERVKFFGVVSDEHLSSLYSQSRALLIPSKFEGFGLGLIEALSCGCPVIASDIPIFRETAKNSILFAPVNDLSMWVSCLNDAWHWSSQQRNAIVKEGKSRSLFFNWESSAKALLDQFYARFY